MDLSESFKFILFIHLFLHLFCTTWNLIIVKSFYIFFYLFIQGDVWVPPGEVSFQADLRDCVYLDQDSQSLEQLEQRRAFSDVGWSELPSPQPCLIPLEWQSLLVPTVPDQCLARWIF